MELGTGVDRSMPPPERRNAAKTGSRRHYCRAGGVINMFPIFYGLEIFELIVPKTYFKVKSLIAFSSCLRGEGSLPRKL